MVAGAGIEAVARFADASHQGSVGPIMEEEMVARDGSIDVKWPGSSVARTKGSGGQGRN